MKIIIVGIVCLCIGGTAVYMFKKMYPPTYTIWAYRNGKSIPLRREEEGIVIYPHLSFAIDSIDIENAKGETVFQFVANASGRGPKTKQITLDGNAVGIQRPPKRVGGSMIWIMGTSPEERNQ